MATSATKIAAGVGCGILGAILIAALLGLGTCAACVGSVASNMEAVEAEKRERLAGITFEGVEGRYTGTGRWFTVSGSVRNGGAEMIDFVRVKVDVLDAEDLVLDTDTTYAVGSDGLAPGAAKTWEVMFDTEGITSYRVAVTE